MRFRSLAFLVPAAANILVALSLTYAQERPFLPTAPPSTQPASPPPTVIQTGGTVTPPVPTAPIVSPTAPSSSKPRDFTNLNDAQKQILFSCKRGAEFLYNMNRNDGRFRYGFVPALNRPLEGDHYLRQVGAAFALARAARFTGEQRYDNYATQAVLTLLDETTVDDPKNPQVRYTKPPSLLVNRLGAAGLLVAAINELPSPQPDVLQQSEELCNFIRKQARADGSLRFSDDGDDGKPLAEDPEGKNEYPGEALYALMLSQRHRPAAWKTELVRKAVAFYHPYWLKHKNAVFVPWQTAAYTEAYLATKEKVFADCVNEMNEAICELQYTQTEQRHPEWRGGFRLAADGRNVDAEPRIDSAMFAESLAEACRVARQAGDVKHYEQFSNALGECLRFLTLLQYTEGNTSHFDESYRKRLLGGFYASHQDGNLRIDYTQHAVSAMVQYLEVVR